MRVKELTTGKEYDCIFQSVDLNGDGSFCFRYNIGILNYQGFHSSFCIYDANEFKSRFQKM